MRSQGNAHDGQRSRRVLQRLRVLDLSMGWAGPLTAMLLADFGAEVVKVESVGHLDWWRGSFAVEDLALTTPTLGFLP